MTPLPNTASSESQDSIDASTWQQYLQTTKRRRTHVCGRGGNGIRGGNGNGGNGIIVVQDSNIPELATYLLFMTPTLLS